MINLLIFILCCSGGTQIIVHGKIFKKVRNYIPFLSCSMCISFWFSAFIYSLFYINGIKMFPEYLSGAFIFSCLGSGTSYILDKIISDNGIKIDRS